MAEYICYQVKSSKDGAAGDDMDLGDYGDYGDEDFSDYGGGDYGDEDFAEIAVKGAKLAYGGDLDVGDFDEDWANKSD